MPTNGNQKAYRRRKSTSLVDKQVMTEHFQEYCSSSSIHGVQYVGDFTRPRVERIWWLLIFAVAFGLNFYHIYQVWYKWQESPVIVSFSETTTPVWQVPFPAVTICLQANSRRHLFHFQTSLEQNKSEEADARSDMSLLCDPHIVLEGSMTLSQASIDFIINVAPDLQDTIQGCKIRNKMVDCEKIFSPVMTEDGVCFTSNVLNHSDIFRPGWSVEPYPSDREDSSNWRLDSGYKKNSPIDTYPMRALDSGDKAGVFIVLAGNKSNQDSLCRGPIPGYKVMLHNPAEVPSSSQRYIRIPIDQEILVWVQPNIMTTSDGLRGYAHKRRQCFYPDERYLKYFSVYTESNCELECLTNYTLKECGCAALYMPRDADTLVCGGGNKECLVNATYNLRKEEVIKSYEGMEEDSCNCLPACTAINYQAEVSQTPFEWRATLEALGEDTSEMQDFTMSRVTIFFSDTQFTTSHRSELFGVVDFLANVGGLLGLFSGISFLSFLEIFYFATLRFWGNIQKRKNERREMGEEMEDMSPRNNHE